MNDNNHERRTLGSLLTAKELSTLKERTQRRIQRMRKSRLRLLEAWFGTTKDRTNASIAQKLGQKPER